eukprot:Em0007g116a
MKRVTNMNSGTFKWRICLHRMDWKVLWTYVKEQATEVEKIQQTCLQNLLFLVREKRFEKCAMFLKEMAELLGALFEIVLHRRDKDMQSHSLDISDLEEEKRKPRGKRVENREYKSRREKQIKSHKIPNASDNLLSTEKLTRDQSGRPTGNVFVHGAYSSIKWKHARTVIPLKRQFGLLWLGPEVYFTLSTE